MDNLAHTLIGVGVARAGLARRWGPGTTLTLAIASNLPDLDALYAWWDPLDRFLLRRTHTHALIMLPVLAAALAAVLRWRRPERPWTVLFGLSALGIALHLLFDLVNSFGVVILWPFTLHRFELASLFIIDLFVWCVMLAPLAAGIFLKSDRLKERCFQGAVALLGLYVVVCVAGNARAESAARDYLARQRLNAAELRLFPEPLGPLRFRAAARLGDQWHVALVHVPGGAVEPIRTVPTQDAAPRVAAIRATPLGKKLDWFMAAPVWTESRDGSVEVTDLRVNSLVIEREGVFVVRFPPGSLEPARK
jgi:inner membrane protein